MALSLSGMHSATTSAHQENQMDTPSRHHGHHPILKRIKAYLRACINTHSSRAGGDHTGKRPKFVMSPRAQPRPRKRRFWMRQITQLYLSPLRKTIEVGGFPPLRPKYHTTVVTPTKMECSAMIIIDKGPNKGLLFEPNTGSNLGHPVGF